MEIKPIDLYQKLKRNLEEPHWWPVDQRYHELNGTDPRFEIIIGAILTQNTSWSNVERALKNLKKNNLLNIKSIFKSDKAQLKEMIKPSGFFNQKEKRLRYISQYLKDNYNSDLDLFFNNNISNLRNELLKLDGIGPETADSILLYAGEFPIFVVDAYTKRICKRLPLNVTLSYDHIQKYFQKDISNYFKKEELVGIYNQLHALIVLFAKNYCKKKPLCEKCFIKNHCDFFKNKSF